MTRSLLLKLLIAEACSSKGAATVVVNFPSSNRVVDSLQLDDSMINGYQSGVVVDACYAPPTETPSLSSCRMISHSGLSVTQLT
jgi:hypothetical protein